MRCRLVCPMRSSVGLASGSTISLSSHCYWIIYLFIYPNINSLGLNESNFNMTLKHINTALLELGLVLEVVLVLDLGLMLEFMGSFVGGIIVWWLTLEMWLVMEVRGW